MIVTLVIGLVMNTKANNYIKNKDLEKIKTYDDRLALVDNIKDGINLRLELIKNAQKSLDICYYLIDNSSTSTVFLDQIIKAADRGVKIRLVTNKFNTSFRVKWWMTWIFVFEENQNPHP